MNSDMQVSRAGNREAFHAGMRDGIPIGLGYFAVAFALGVAARSAGLHPFQGFIASLLCLASAGQYAGFSVIAAGGSYLEIAVITLVINARYLLMSTAISQRLGREMKPVHRFGIAYFITDEIFAAEIRQKGNLNPYFTYGAGLVAAPMWALGTMLGILAGNLMPGRLVSALSVALFGMFLAVIIPPSRKDRVILGLVTVSFAASYSLTKLPAVWDLSPGMRVILLTIVLSAGAAMLFPHPAEEDDAAEEDMSGKTSDKTAEKISEKISVRVPEKMSAEISADTSDEKAGSDGSDHCAPNAMNGREESR